MIGRIPARAAGLVAAALTVGALAGASTAGAAAIYNNLPKPKPGNVASEGFEATSTSEFGGLVAFAGSARVSPTVTVMMSSWACQNLLGGASCKTSPGATFEWPITVNLYELGPENEPGALIASVTQNVAVPYRPSANTKLCTPNGEGAVGWGKECFHGKAFKVGFAFPGVTLPSQAIVSVAYNTTNYGYAPTHAADVGEDSLNVGITEPPEVATVGTDPLPENAFVNSQSSAMYEGEGTTGSFNRAGGWNGFQPMFRVVAHKH